MQNLDSTLTLNKKTVDSADLTDRFTNDDLVKIGVLVIDNFNRDLASRKNWQERTEAAMDLALQVSEAKTFPWQGCANIAFPLVTIAAMQFHARAYPTIVNGRDIVRMKINASDKDGIVSERAKLIGEHMSWQLLEQDEAWEEGADRSLLNVAIVGCGFKKSYFSASKGHNVSEFVPAKDLVINYWAQSVETAPVKTHIIPLYKNDIHERILRGSYRDIRNENWFTSTHTAPEEDARKNQRQGIHAQSDDPNSPFDVLEQHLDLDLDNDGYAEPYIITVERNSGCVLRIVVRFNRVDDIEYDNKDNIISIRRVEYFTKIPFIPSPDCGIYDIGFGILLGPLNESVNSAMNQLFDAGTLANTAGGFLGRGAKIRGGRFDFRPFEWQRVDATGDDLRKSIFPLPVREPSAVMFQLISLIIDYVGRVGGASDMMVGKNPGQNTPAETSRNTLQQGQAVYSAIFKRIWRSMKLEFQKLYLLNAFHLPATMSFGQSGKMIRREDYMLGSSFICPTADPTLSSASEVFAQAQLTREAALSGVGGYNHDEVERRYLKALGVDEIDKIFPGSDKMPPPAPDVKLQIQEMKQQLEMAKLQGQQQMFMMTLMENRRLNEAKIMQLTAHAEQLQATAVSEPQKRSVEAFRAAIEAIREHNNKTTADLDRMMENMNASDRSVGTGNSFPQLEGPENNQALLSQAGQAPAEFNGGLG